MARVVDRAKLAETTSKDGGAAGGRGRGCAGGGRAGGGRGRARASGSADHTARNGPRRRRSRHAIHHLGARWRQRDGHMSSGCSCGAAGADPIQRAARAADYGDGRPPRRTLRPVLPAGRAVRSATPAAAAARGGWHDLRPAHHVLQRGVLRAVEAVQGARHATEYPRPAPRARRHRVRMVALRVSSRGRGAADARRQVRRQVLV